MPNVKIELAGKDKENLPVTAVVIGGKRWGKNGESFATPQFVPAGQATVTLHYVEGTRTVERDVPDTTNTVTLKITSDDASSATAEFV